MQKCNTCFEKKCRYLDSKHIKTQKVKDPALMCGTLNGGSPDQMLEIQELGNWHWF
jgi:hypothetical protein